MTNRRERCEFSGTGESKVPTYQRLMIISSINALCRRGFDRDLSSYDKSFGFDGGAGTKLDGYLPVATSLVANLAAV